MTALSTSRSATPISTASRTAPLPSALPTAPLSPSARDALRSLELKVSFPLDVAVAVTVYESAAVHAADLAAVAASGRMSDLDADSLAAAEDLMAGARATLAAAGRLDLIGVAS